MAKITLELEINEEQKKFVAHLVNQATGVRLGYGSSAMNGPEAHRETLMKCMDYFSQLLKGRVLNQDNKPIHVDF